MRPPFKLQKPPHDAIALVTGGGSGIGRCYALRLAAMGYDVLLVGLKADELFAVKSEIEAEHKVRKCQILVLDLANLDSAEKLIEWCKERDLEPSVVINNAGVFAFCDLMQVETDRMERLLMLHCVTLTKLCRYFACFMSKRGGGYILNMSSYSQWMPFPGLSLYASSKAYVKSLSVALSKEVESDGVVVTTLSPAGVATELYGLPDNLQKLGLRLGVLISADSCARRGLNALGRGRRCVIPDWWNALFIPICRHLPNFVEQWLRRKTKQFQK